MQEAQHRYFKFRNGEPCRVLQTLIAKWLPASSAIADHHFFFGFPLLHMFRKLLERATVAPVPLQHAPLLGISSSQRRLWSSPVCSGLPSLEEANTSRAAAQKQFPCKEMGVAGSGQARHSQDVKCVHENQVLVMELTNNVDRPISNNLSNLKYIYVG